MHRNNGDKKCYVCSKSYPTKADELYDDQQTSVFYPHRIGSSILICGKKSSSFPFQLFVGPDWPCMCITYCLIIGPTALFIHNIGQLYGPGIIFLTLFLLIITLGFYSFTACTDPGIVFVNAADRDDVELGGVGAVKGSEVTNLANTGHHAVSLDSPEGSNHSKEGSNSDNNSLGGGGGVVRVHSGGGGGAMSSSSQSIVVAGSGQNHGKIECGLCQIQRPRNAYHCHDCGVCVMELDHHCPWTGKCIGKKTIKSFYAFLWSLSILIGYVILMVIITAVRGSPVFGSE